MWPLLPTGRRAGGELVRPPVGGIAVQILDRPVHGNAANARPLDVPDRAETVLVDTLSVQRGELTQRQVGHVIPDRSLRGSP